MNVKAIPLSEVMEVMHQDVQNFKEVLCEDKSDETIRHILEEIGEYPIDERLPKQVTNFISKMLEDFTNCTAEELSNTLTVLAEELEKAISFCQHKDNVQFVSTILKVMLKHADEVTRWMEEEMH